MPTYEYECTKCAEKFELFQSIRDRAKKTLVVDCSDCNNRAPVVRCISAGGGLIFKGSGFYITDYRSEGYKQAAKAESDNGKKTSETKPESAPSKTTSDATSPASSSDGAASKPPSSPRKRSAQIPAPRKRRGTTGS
jgi:putative FmdB family regulatory protein